MQLHPDDVHRLADHASIINDMLCGAGGIAPSNVTINRIWGDNGNRRRAAEAFAEMMKTQLSNPEAWAAIKQRLPRAAAEFEALIQEALNGRHHR